MDLLILGGTVFLGRHLAEQALARGHRVTLFHRGKHGADLFPAAEHILGDRNESLDALRGRTWDAVIDTSGYFPRQVRATAEAVRDSVKHYTFVSSASVYSDTTQIGIDETAPVGTLDDPTLEQITGETYGPLKALCEAAAEAAMPGRVLIVRPTLIVGPHDPTNRFAYWPRRFAAGGTVLAPAPADAPVQIIDARDLAAWILDGVEAGRTGVYNGIGPDAPTTMGEILETCRQVAGPAATIRWVDEAFLVQNEVQPWVGLPLWIPQSDPDTAGFSRMSNARAVAAGLRFRPLADIVRDTLAWDQATPPSERPDVTLTREREAELLHIWETREAEPNP
jgi:2'-hydroxyisoflavone reductase